MLREILHKSQFEMKVPPITCANAAAFNTAHTTTNVDTLGCEAVTFLLSIGGSAQTPDYVFELFDTNVSVTDAGAICAAADVIVHSHGALGAINATSEAKCVASTGVLTMTANADESTTYSFTYIGAKRWVRLQCPTGTKTEIFSVVVVKQALDREPTIA